MAQQGIAGVWTGLAMNYQAHAPEASLIVLIQV